MGRQDFIIKNEQSDYFKINDIDLVNKKALVYLAPNGCGKTRISNKIFERAAKAKENTGIRPVMYYKDSLEVKDGKIPLNNFFAYSNLVSTLEEIERRADDPFVYRNLPLTGKTSATPSISQELFLDFVKSWSDIYFYYEVSWLREPKKIVFLETDFFKSAIAHIDIPLATKAHFMKMDKLDSDSRLQFNYFANIDTTENDGVITRKMDVSDEEWSQYILTDLFKYIENFNIVSKTDPDYASALIGLKRFLILRFLLGPLFKEDLIRRSKPLLNQIGGDISLSLSSHSQKLDNLVEKVDIKLNTNKFIFSYNSKTKMNSLSIISASGSNITKQFIDKLSKGERGRFNFSICMFIVGLMDKSKTFLILDDPVDSYDSYHKSVMSSFLKELADNGLKIILFSHDVEMVSQSKYADRFFFERHNSSPLDINSNPFIMRNLINLFIKNFELTKDIGYVTSLLFMSRRLYEQSPSFKQAIEGLEGLFYDSTISPDILINLVTLIYNKSLTSSPSSKFKLDKFAEYMSIKLGKVLEMKRLFSVNEGVKKIDKIKAENKLFINLISHNEENSLNYLLMTPVKVIETILSSIKNELKPTN